MEGAGRSGGIALDAKNMRGDRGRAELDVIARAAPSVARVGQKIAHSVAFSRTEAQGLEIQIDPTRLDVAPVEVHHRQDRVPPVGGAFAVADHLRVIEGVKVEAAV